MSSTDIREWARSQGLDVNAKGPVNNAAKQAYAEAHGEYDDDRPPVGYPVDSPEVSQFTPGESTPEVTLTWKDKLKRNPAGRAASKQVAKRPRGRRKSLEDVGSLGWLALASAADHMGGGPVARCLAFQAPVAGAILEDSLKGTVADRVLQPVARMATGGGDLGALLAPPILIGLAQQRPELYPKLEPIMISCLKRYFKIAGPKLKKLAREEEELTEELGGVSIEEILDAMFTGKPITPEMMGE